MTTTTTEPTARLHIAPQHDFFTKLLHPSVFARTQEYIAWRQALARARANGVPELPTPRLTPVSINLDLTTACNYYCGHCVDLKVLNSGRNFVNDELFSSLTYLADNGLRSVILIGGGEPTVHPKFQEVVRFLKNRGMQVAVVSNGSRTDVVHGVADCLTGKDWVRFSLDSGTEDTFQKMHRPRKPITLGEICAGVSRIRERNPLLSIGFSFVIVWDQKPLMKNATVEKDAVVNIHEMVEAAVLARDSGFSYISFKPFLNRFPDGGEVMNPDAMTDMESTIMAIRTGLEGARLCETKTFRVLESTNLRVLLNKAWKPFMHQPCVCHMQAFRHVLSPLGVFNCPAKRGVPKARLGNKDGFADETRITAVEQSVVAHLDSFDASRECVEITCLYNLANWEIEKAIQSGYSGLEAQYAFGEQDLFL